MSAYRLTVFGTIRPADTIQAHRLKSEKVRALMLYLMAEYQRPHRRTTLARLFWPDSEPQLARQSLRQALYDIRRIYEATGGDQDPPLLISDRIQVQLNPALHGLLDLSLFEQQLKLVGACACRIEANRCHSCFERLDQAVGMVGGPFGGDLDLPKNDEIARWLALQRSRMGKLLIEALLDLLRSSINHQDEPRSLHYAGRIFELEPWNEESHHLLMLYYANSGRQGEALQQYRRYCEALRADLDLDASPELRALELKIRNNGHALAERQMPSALPISPVSHTNGMNVLLRKQLFYFRMIDADNDDLIGWNNVRRGPERLAQLRGWSEDYPPYRQIYALTQAWWDQICFSLNRPASAQISRHEWLEYWAAWHTTLGPPESAMRRELTKYLYFLVETIVGALDRDGDGALTYDEYGEFLWAWGSQQHHQPICRILDADRDGLLSIEELVQRCLEYYVSDDPDSPGNMLKGFYDVFLGRVPATSSSQSSQYHVRF